MRDKLKGEKDFEHCGRTGSLFFLLRGNYEYDYADVARTTPFENVYLRT